MNVTKIKENMCTLFDVDIDILDTKIASLSSLINQNNQLMFSKLYHYNNL